MAVERTPLPVVRGTTDYADCAACPLAKDGQPVRPVTAEGPANPAWIIVGMEPGSTEIALGRPFVGMSGQIVAKALGAIQRPRDEVWITNAAACWRPGASDAMRWRAAECCAPRLEAELAQFPGKPILALGATAAQIVLKDTSFRITERSGTYYRTDFAADALTPDRAVIPSIHPAAMLRGGGASANHAPDLGFWNLIYDASKVDAIARGRNIVFGEELGVDWDHEWEDPKRGEQLIEYVVQEIRRTGVGACDTECYVKHPERQESALRPRQAHLRAIGLGTRDYAASVYWPIMTTRGKRLVRELFATPTIHLDFHNRLYDLPVLRRHGFPVLAKAGCTMLRHHSAFPGAAHDLQTVTAQFYAVSAWKSEFRDGDDTPEALTRYCSKDTQAAARLAKPLDAALKALNAERTYAIDLEMAEIAEDMHEAGVLVSRQVNEELRQRFTDAIKKHREALEAKVYEPAMLEKVWDYLAFEMAKKRRMPKDPAKHDPPDFESRHAKRLAEIKASYVKIDKKTGLPSKKRWRFSPGAPNHVIAYLRAVGVVFTQLTDKGAISTKKDILKEMSYIPEVGNITSFKENTKLLSTFCVKMFDRQAQTVVVEPASYWLEKAAAAAQRATRAKSPENQAKARDLADKCRAVAAEAPQEREERPVFKYGFADEHGRIHPRWSIHKITGRWGAEDPMFQNWPKADKRTGRPNLRAQCVAPPGMVLVGFDFAQLEARIIALLSGDPWLVDIFAAGKDVHTEFARVVWPEFDSLDPAIRKVLRDQVKRLEFGGFYGGTAEGLWKKVVGDVPDLRVEDVARALAFMRKAMPGVTAWHQELFRTVAKPPFELRSAIYGRRRVFPLGQADESDVKNFTVQATGADVMNTALKILHPRLRNFRGARLICQIHDFAAIECRDADKDKMKALVIACATQEHTHKATTIRFPVDAKIGASLADV